jgi:hypothetical protein
MKQNIASDAFTIYNVLVIPADGSFRYESYRLSYELEKSPSLSIPQSHQEELDAFPT